MRRFLPCFIFLIIGLIVGSMGFWLISKNNEALPIMKTDPNVETVNAYQNGLIENEYTNKQLLDFAYTALSYIHVKDYEALASIVHPEYGLVFSPYTTINLSSNKCFTSAQVSDFGEDLTDYVWGVRENGEPIELTPEDYFSQYVYVYDYSNAHIIGINNIVRSGNALENVEIVFPDSNYIDFYVSGKNQEDNGDNISWSILRLVFEDYNDILRLTGIIHSEYTA